MEHPDLARGAIVYRRAVEDRQHRVGALDPRSVLGEDPRRCDVDAGREFVLVRNEDLEVVGAQRGGALVDERALVRREQRTGEVDLQNADATELESAVGGPSLWAVRCIVRRAGLDRAE
jgi:hypothetical protein